VNYPIYSAYSDFHRRAISQITPADLYTSPGQMIDGLTWAYKGAYEFAPLYERVN
jgi:hypothetical protein